MRSVVGLLAAAGDVTIFAAFPFLGTASHEDGVTAASFSRIVVPFVVGWAIVGLPASAFAQATVGSFGRTLRIVPASWLGAGIIAMAIRVWGFDRPFVLAFALVAVGVTGGLLVAWRLILAFASRRCAAREARA